MNLGVFENVECTRTKFQEMMKVIFLSIKGNMSIQFSERRIGNLSETPEDIKFKLSGHVERDVEKSL